MEEQLFYNFTGETIRIISSNFKFPLILHCLETKYKILVCPKIRNW